jgi:hypothetical protein
VSPTSPAARRPFPPTFTDPQEKARKSIHSALATARKAIEGEMPELVKFLDKHIVYTNYDYIYLPDERSPD